MAAYPSYKQLIGTDEVIYDDVVTDRVANGTVKSRAMYPAIKRGFKVRHRLTADELSNATTGFMKFYTDNRLLAVTFTFAKDGQAYTCLFDGPPKLDHLSKGQTLVEVTLLQQ